MLQGKVLAEIVEVPSSAWLVMGLLFAVAFGVIKAAGQKYEFLIILGFGYCVGVVDYWVSHHLHSVYCKVACHGRIYQHVEHEVRGGVCMREESELKTNPART